MVARSRNGGRRWGPPVVIGRTSGFPPSDTVSQNLLATIGGLPSQTVTPNGDVYVAWSEPGPNRRRSRVAVARSKDGGAHLEDPCLARPWPVGAAGDRGDGCGTVGLLH